MTGSADHALAIDVGTQSVRAILFDPQGDLVAMGRVPIEPYVAPQPGWAEQDPEVWWTARLTGEWVDSTASQVGYLPFDFKRGEWVGRLDWKWRVAPFERSWLPRLVPPTGRLGELKPAAAEHLGVRAGTLLIAAAGDKQCEALGA